MKQKVIQLLCALSVAVIPAQALGANCPATQANFAALRQQVLTPAPDHIVVVAHRACFAAAPENTPDAIEACFRMGVEVVENDVRRTKDGELVVFHDDELSRMTDRWGYVSDMTLSELREAKLKERDGSSSAYSGGRAYLTSDRITTLREYLAAVRYKVLVNFEIKTSDPVLWKSIFDQSVQIARELGVMDHLLFKIPDTRNHGATSANHWLASMRFDKDVQLAPILWESPADPKVRFDFLSGHQPALIEVPFSTPDFLARVSEARGHRKTPLMAVAVQPFWSGGHSDSISMDNPDNGWGKLISDGANIIMTDRPEALLRYLERTDRRVTRPCR